MRWRRISRSDPPAATTAEAVFESQNDGDDTTTPYVISVRSADHFALATCRAR